MGLAFTPTKFDHTPDNQFYLCKCGTHIVLKRDYQFTSFTVCSLSLYPFQLFQFFYELLGLLFVCMPHYTLCKVGDTIVELNPPELCRSLE